MNTQPNFERFKTTLYNGIVGSYKNNHKVFEHLLLETIGGNSEPLHERYKVFKQDFNKWLDTLDIRRVSFIVDKTKADIKYPKYLLEGSYSLDYNKFDMLDIIILK